MDRRTAPGAKPPAKADEAKKPTAASSRMGTTARTPTSPSTTRPSTLSSRTAGSTISKPPTRPTASSSLRKPAGKSEDGTSAAGDENKRPSSRTTPTLGGASPKTTRTEPSADKTRRTTLGGATTSAPPKRPSTLSSRTNTASPTSRRTPTSTASRPTTAASAKSPKSDSSKSTASVARPISRDTIPEEPTEARPSAQDAAEPSGASSTDTAHSPRKLEIRALNSSLPPTLKPQAVSDAELEMRPKPISRHSRTRSVQVDNAQDQGMRNMAMMTSLLRDSSEKDNMASQIKQLKSDNARLNDGIGQYDGNQREAVPEKAQEAHAKEIETLKTSHQTAITTLESAHTSELQKIRSELDQQQRQSSKLEGVESKIQAVEQALQESKSRASQNEAELQKKVLDRDQLAVVVHDLKAEIDRCQKQLDADVAKQAGEKKEAIKTMEKLKQEMEEERARYKTQFEKLEKEKQDMQRKLDAMSEASEKEKQDTETRMNEAAEKVEQEVDMLRQSNAEAETTVKQLQDELDAMKKAESDRAEKSRSADDERSNTINELKEQIQRLRDEHAEELKSLQTAATKQAEKSGKATDDSKSIISDLNKQIDLLKGEHTKALERAQQQARANEDISHDLRSELEAIEKVQEKERRNHKKIQDETQGVVDSLQAQITQLQTDGSNGSKVAEELQTQLEELRQVNSSAETKYDDELQELKNIIEGLRHESSGVEQVHKEALEQRDEETKKLQALIEELRSKTKSLEQQIDDATDSASIIEQLRGTTDALRNEADLLKQRAEAESTAKEKETNELKQVVEDLQVKVKQYEDEIAEAGGNAEKEEAKTKAETERLQGKIENLERRLKEGNDEIESATAQIKEMSEKYELREQEIQHQRNRSVQMKDDELNNIREKLEQREQQIADLKLATKSAQEKDDRIKDLQDSLKHAEEMKNMAEESLAFSKEQMGALNSSLETFQADAEEKEAHHYNNLNKTKRELTESHNTDMQTLRDSHAKALDDLREGFGLDGSATAEDLVKELTLLVAKKYRFEGELEDADIRHNREMEEESQKHESAYKDLQDAFKQVKESQAKALAEQEKQREALQANKTKMQSEHEAMLTDVKAENEKVVDGLRAELEQSASKSKADLETAVEELSAEHERNVQAVMEKHAQQIAAAEEEAIHSGADKDRGHEQRLAVLEAEHAEALKRATASPSPAGRAVSGLSAEEQTPSTPQMGESEGLGHVFVNHEDEEEGLSARKTEGKAETPLAYHSEDELVVPSPTPAYPRGGNRAGSHMEANKAPKMDLLRKENEELIEQLKEAMEEITTLKKSSRATGAKDIISSTERMEDPFAPSSASAEETTRPRRNSAPRQPSPKSGPASPQMSLEGTLESLRVQTEQLLEVNDDIMAENRRWSQRLRTPLRSSQRRSLGLNSSSASTPGVRAAAS